jgi:hypothetical protein
MISARGVRVWCGAMGLLLIRKDYWTAIGTSDRYFYYTQTENFQYFEQRILSGYNMRMLSG